MKTKFWAENVFLSNNMSGEKWSLKQNFKFCSKIKWVRKKLQMLQILLFATFLQLKSMMRHACWSWSIKVTPRSNSRALWSFLLLKYHSNWLEGGRKFTWHTKWHRSFCTGLMSARHFTKINRSVSEFIIRVTGKTPILTKRS